MRRIDPSEMIGKRFGRLLVVGLVQDTSRVRRYTCKCDCGKIKAVRQDDLRDHAGTRSCGCLKGVERKYGSRACHSIPEYSIWHRMLRRCHNAKYADYKTYGQRGIVVCDRWRTNFQAFFDDMGPRPSPKHSIDRIDNDGNYEPSNCRWATATEQARNRRSTHLLRCGDVVGSVAEWSEVCGIDQSTLLARINHHNWSPVDAVLVPVGGRRGRPASACSPTSLGSRCPDA